MSPLLMNTTSSSVPMEPLDDMDETASESNDGMEHSNTNTTNTTTSASGKLILANFSDKFQEMVAWLAAQPKLNARSKSGYILFSAEVRKKVMVENPEAGFGEVSKIVGIEWKKLSEEQKKQYEVRAEYIANERAKQEAREPVNYRLLETGLFVKNFKFTFFSLVKFVSLAVNGNHVISSSIILKNYMII
ncbi:unnamed protein product [Gongylonema pulchrum]|uniref:HMG box domain-containing protein n=1 Tax=Gongylonema pulchrum TaxID=637853 RepID=A0A183E6I0_9BILA|nr:unnamed protein product [Gongylonema pulchrum]